MLTRRTDFLTDYTTVTYMIKYRNEKGEVMIGIDREESVTERTA